MIKGYNNKSLLFGIPGLVMQCIGFLHPLLLWGGTVLLIVGLMYYAKSKGHSLFWGLFGILNFLGIIVLVALKDKESDQNCVEGKKSSRIFIYILLGFALVGVVIMRYMPEKDGLRTEYYENGQLRVEAPYKNGVPDGVVKNYYESGRLQVEGVFKNGKREGLSKEYYENGQLKAEQVYRDGEPVEEMFKEYNENGTPK